jgi:hypothetical protein
MVDQVNSLGIPTDDSQINDPGTDDDGPLSAVTQGGARRAAADRYNENSDEMEDLRQQYANTSKQQADAYAQQKAQIDAATRRLTEMPTGPSDQEKLYRLAAAYSAPVGNFGNAISGVNQTQADILKERREAEMQKQQLLAQYGMAGPQATIGMTNSRLGQIAAQERIAGSQLNSAGGQQFRGQTNLPWYVKDNGDGSYALQPGAERVMDQQAMSKLFGRFTLIPQPDGSKKIVMLGGQMPAAPQQAPQTQTAPPQQVQQPPQRNGGVPAPQAPRVVAAPSTTAPPPPATPQQQAKPLPTPYDDLFLPSTVLDPKYGALTPATKPAYVATAAQAFDPGYFKEYQFHANNYGDMDIRKKNIEVEGKELGDAGNAAQSTIYNYGQALQNMDQLADPKLLSGPAGLKVGAFENTLRGVLPDAVTEKLFNDPDLKKLATQQDTDKYFLNAATTGLKAIYGGRITNMEVQQRLKSLPSNNLLPAVTKMLAAAQAEVAQDTVNRSKLFGAYVSKGGDPSPTRFNTWYEANFSPFHQSRLKDNLDAQKAIAVTKAAPPAVAVQNPLVAYYIGPYKAWVDGGRKGPQPPKPQAQ